MSRQDEDQPRVQQTVVIVGKQKSVGAAFLLAFLFGPIGLLYATLAGGVVMMLLAFVVGIVTFGLALIPIWLGSVVWAVIAANQANKRLASSVNLTANVGHAEVAGSESRPPVSAPPQDTTASSGSASPRTGGSMRAAQPAFDLATGFDQNQRSVAVGAVGIAVMLLAIVAFKFVMGLDFGRPSTTSQEGVRSSSPAPSGRDRLERGIPSPRVPMTPATSVLPSWTQSEDIEGNFPMLTGLYVGALGKRPFKLVVASVDSATKRITGYTETPTATTAFDGTYTLSLEAPNSRVASNVISVRTWVFQATLFEPDGIGGNGVFQLRFAVTDAQGSSVYGTWTSYDGRLYREVKLSDPVSALER